MNQYYYLKDSEKIGPIELNQLKENITNETISQDTLVWFNGIDDWTKAKDIEELRTLFNTPPPIPKKQISVEKEQVANTKISKPKKRKGRFLFWLIPLLIILGFAGNYGVNKLKQDKIKTNERYFASRYLSVDNLNNKVNLLLDDVIKGTLSNTSKHTIYGEINLELRWFDKKGKYITKSKYTIDETLLPYGSTNFKIKDTSPLRARTYEVIIRDALVIMQY